MSVPDTLNPVRQQIAKLIFSNTAKDSSYLLVGSFLSVGVGFATTLILAPQLGLAQFGIFVTALSFAQLIAELFELGVNAATLNFVSGKDRSDRNKFATTALLLRLILSTLLGVVLFALAPLLAEGIFKDTQFVEFIRMTSWGGILFMSVSWLQAFFQAEGRFRLAANVNLTVNISRMGLILLLIGGGALSAYTAYLSSQLAFILPLIGFGLFFGFAPWKTSVNFKDFKSMFLFGLPIGAGLSLMAVYSRVDQLIVFRLLSESEAGMFGLATRIASLFIFASYALGAALVPRFVQLGEKNFTSYFKKTLLACVGLAGLILLSLFTSPILIPLFFGEAYRASVLTYQILSVGMMFFVFSFQIQNAIVYQFKKNMFLAQIGVVSIVVLFPLLWWGTLSYGVTGAASAATIMYVTQFLASSLYLFQLMRARATAERSK